ncbi:MAG: Uma2 family endonuclease, partial [Blastocatellia bacterium]
MTVMHRWTVAELERIPDDGNLYEIIDGELLVSKQPHYYHQLVRLNIGDLLGAWNRKEGLGGVNLAPGI